ncbi:hypothetical protein E1298_46850 [Actinomadura rubrisoli]|uniref:Uncharacterized protein n=1 Tax=Actinomadura rubrisoli TaxID=2530368 RepID=A0A4R4ZMC8_9ACTN|nr:hypothetical protein E1298_46850 [Actinomadura rubrisoli]
MFPPKHLERATADALAEILERPNPPRRMRTYPRVVKRQRHNSFRVKKSTDHGVRHPRPPEIYLFSPAA